MKKLEPFQKDVATQASIVYNDMYRDKSTSKFVITDCIDKDLNGRVGYIDWYDSVKVHALVCPKGTSDFSKGVPMLVCPKSMEPMHKVLTSRLHRYNREPKLEYSNVVLGHWEEGGESFQIRVHHNVLRYITQMYGIQGTYPAQAFESMKTMIGDIERHEQQENEKVNRQKEEYDEALEKFFSGRTPVTQTPRKRAKKSLQRSNTSRTVQVNSVWKAKLEHIYSNMNHAPGNDGEHLFTFPFATTDNSLVACSTGLKELNQHHAAGVGSDSIFASCVETHPIVLTTASVRSLSPGVDIDDDVLNLCLKWMTCGASGVRTFGTGFTSTLFAAPPSKWMESLTAMDNKLCRHSFMLFPFDANGYKSLFVVVGAKNVRHYNGRQFKGSRPCILHLDPFDSPRGRHNSNAVADKLRTLLNIFWRADQSVTDPLIAPYNQRSLPLSRPYGEFVRHDA